MARQRSILDLKHKVPPAPHVAMRELDSGRWQVAIMFSGAVEAMIFDRPTRRGAENETIYQCRKRGHQGWKSWDTLENIWGVGNVMV